MSALRDRFAGARFADETVYGVMLIPDPERLGLGKPDRGIGSARIAPTIAIP